MTVLGLKNQWVFGTAATELFCKNVISKKTIIFGKVFVKVFVKPNDTTLVVLADAERCIARLIVRISGHH